jgi:bacterioferritin-associated ferredoxin
MVCMQITSQVIYCTVNASCASKPRLHLWGCLGSNAACSTCRHKVRSSVI